MATQIVQPAETQSKKSHVQMTVRMDPELHERLRDFVYSLGRGRRAKERPSIDDVVQGFVRDRLDPGAPDLGDLEGVPQEVSHLCDEFVRLIQSPRPGEENVRDFIVRTLNDARGRRQTTQ